MEKNDIFDHIAHDDGRKVPEGYFEDFAARMEASLPEQPWEKGDGAVMMPPRSLWQRVRPYVYMAAMFAGVWCMMHIFDIMSPKTPEAAFADNPVLAQALSDETFVEELELEETDIDDMLDDMYASGFTVADLKASPVEDNL